MHEAKQPAEPRTIPMIRQHAEEGDTPRSTAARGAAAAAKRVIQKKEIRESTGIKLRPHAATGDIDYSDDRREFLIAVDAFKRKTGRVFLTTTEYLDVAESLGWTRAGQMWGSFEAPTDDVASYEAHVA